LLDSQDFMNIAFLISIFGGMVSIHTHEFMISLGAMSSGLVRGVAVLFLCVLSNSV
jgi:hypothetical protein